MGVYTKEEQFKLIKDDWRNLEKIDNQYEEVCLQAVKQNRYALEYVENQTLKICLESVKYNGWTLEFVKEELLKEKRIKYILYLYAYLNLGGIYSINKIDKDDFRNTLEDCFNNYALSKKIFFIYDDSEFFDEDSEFFDYDAFEIFLEEISSYINSFSKIYNLKDYDFFRINIKLLYNMQDYLTNKCYNNYFLIPNYVDINNETIKKIALSNNNLVVIDDNKVVIKPIYNILANNILFKEELLQESF